MPTPPNNVNPLLLAEFRRLADATNRHGILANDARLEDPLFLQQEIDEMNQWLGLRGAEDGIGGW